MNKKILLIVEGNKVEPNVFNKLQNIFNLEFEIYCFGTNIYSLYKIMEENDFNVNIKDVLLELHPDRKDILLNKFVYTYLIFDLDPHHTKKDESRTIEDIIFDNIKKVEKMAEYFIDETDPTIGKLYINYPMMESYKACDKFFDEKYIDENISIDSINNFKEYVGKKKLANIRLESYTRDNFEQLIIQNIFKMNYINSNKWEMPSYERYLKDSNTLNLLLKEKEIINDKKYIYPY